MAFPSVTYSFTNGTTADADEVNQNFSDIISGMSDGTKDLNVAQVDAAGTFSATGAVTLSSTLDVTGATEVSGDLTVNTNKFIVAALSGNTTVAGTLDVSGVTTLSSNLAVSGTVTLSSATTVDDDLNVTGTLDVTNDFAVNSTMFTVAAATGNTAVGGTLSVAGNTTLSGTVDSTNDFTVNSNKFIVDAGTGNTTVAGTLDVSGAVDFTSGLTINTNKFLVAALTGNTTIFGTLDVGDDFDVNSGKFTVDASTGNTVSDGSITVGGASSLQALTATTGSFSSTLSATGDFAINTNMFTVSASTGNTDIAGNLDVSGTVNSSGLLGTYAVFTTTLGVNGAVTLEDDVSVGGTLTVSGFYASSSFVGVGTTTGTGSSSPIFEVNGGVSRFVNNSGKVMQITGSNSAGSIYTEIYNSSVTEDSRVYIDMYTAAQGDSFILTSNATSAWSFGLDKSKDHDWVLVQNSVLGDTNEAIRVDRTTQDVTLKSLDAASAGKYRGVIVDEDGKLQTTDSDMDAVPTNGSVNVTLVGCGTATTGIAKYYRNGNLMTVFMPEISGISTGTSMHVTIPAALTPSETQYSGAVPCANNGNTCLGSPLVSSAGAVYYMHAQDNATDVDLDFTGWNNSGAKGVLHHSLTYYMD